MTAHFFESRYPLVVILAVAVLFSLWSPFFSFSVEGVVHALIGTPNYWFDEASVVEAARGLVELGRLDIAIEPGRLSGFPYYVNTPGFPIALPLAGVFSLFGFGVLQIRFVALFFLFLTICIAFFLWENMFGPRAAFWGVLLIATFAPFYANGKTITGEVPGFLFLLISLFFIYYKRWHSIGGAFAALALVTKPSMFLFIIPVFFLEFLLAERPFWKGALRVAGGALPVIIVWLLIMFPNPFALRYWKGAFSIYTNHYPEPSVLAEFSGRWFEIFTHSTVLYILLLFFCLFGVRALYGDRIAMHHRRIMGFVVFYSLFAFFYFLLSPGWLRYLLVAEMFLLLLAYPVLRVLFHTIPVMLPEAAVVFLLVMHVAVFIFFAEIKSGLTAPLMASQLNERLRENENATIGIINAIQISSLISSERRFLVVDCGGGCTVGTHPLSLAEDLLPTYVVISARQREEAEPYHEVLIQYYKEYPEERNGYLIYEKSK